MKTLVVLLLVRIGWGFFLQEPLLVHVRFFPDVCLSVGFFGTPSANVQLAVRVLVMGCQEAAVIAPMPGATWFAVCVPVELWFSVLVVVGVVTIWHCLAVRQVVVVLCVSRHALSVRACLGMF